MQYAHLGGQNYPVILGHIIASRSQPVPVQHAADNDTIAESDSRRPVPGFHHKIMVAVKIPFAITHQRIFFPGFRNHHHHGVGQRMPCHIQIFQTVIEHGRIAAAGIHHREYFFQIRKIRAAGFTFPGVQPVNISLDSIDFTVMDNIPVRMGPGPAGESIGTKTGMYQGDGRGKIQIRQIQIKMPQLHGSQHPFIDHGPGRQTGDIKICTHLYAGRNNFPLRHLADDIQLSLKVHLILNLGILLDENLPKTRTHCFRDAANQAFINRNFTPA